MTLFSNYLFKSGYKRFLVAIFDFVGALIFFPVRLIRPSFSPQQVRRILVLRLDPLGDIILTRPAIATLHRRFPGAAIDLMVTGSSNAALFQHERGIHSVIASDCPWFTPGSTFPSWFHFIISTASTLKKNHYDLAIDFRGDLRNIALLFLSGIPVRLGYGITGGRFLLTHSETYLRQDHQVITNLKLLRSLGITAEVENLPFVYSSQQKELFWQGMEKKFTENSLSKVVIHPGAGYPSKRWASEKFAALIRKMTEDGIAQIVLIGSEQEKNLLSIDSTNPLIVDLRGKSALMDLPILFDSCHLYIGNDSGPAHIAAAQGIEMLILFSGTNLASVWKPWAKQLHLFQYEVPCSPCESRECPLKHHDCLEKISAQKVLDHAQAILKKQSAELV